MDDERAARLAQAAQRQGLSESEFIRQAIDEAVARVDPGTLYDALDDYVGCVSGDGSGYARHVDAELVAILADRSRSRRSQRGPDGR